MYQFCRYSQVWANQDTTDPAVHCPCAAEAAETDKGKDKEVQDDKDYEDNDNNKDE